MYSRRSIAYWLLITIHVTAVFFLCIKAIPVFTPPSLLNPDPCRLLKPSFFSKRDRERVQRMAPLQHLNQRKVLLLYLLFVFIISTFISATHSQHQPQNHGRTRMLLQLKDENQNSSSIVIKKPKTDTKNQTKLVKPSNLSKNQTKLIKPHSDSPMNKTKIIKNTSSSSNTTSPQPNIKSHLKKLNSTSNLTKKLSDLPKPSTPKNKTTKPITIKETNSHLRKQIDEEEDEEDLVSEFRDLPSKFQESFLPDMEKISTTSKFYLTRYNKEFTKGFKPYVGNKYAATIASSVSFAFIIIPLILVSLIFSRITAYFSLQKFLIFIQIYLAIYFTILAMSSLVTGLEPLKFFYTTSHSTYVCVQVLQTLGYVLYLLLLLMYLVLVFSTETGLGTKLLGLGQTFVGFAVGLHYYITVFHRAVLHQPPKASWKVHALYATCFVVICLLGQAHRRKKAYLEEGGEEGKRS